MSVTFFIPHAGFTDKQEECQCLGEWKECLCCGGTGWFTYPESKAPTVNLANDNAKTILFLLGMETEVLGGELLPEQIGNVRQRIVLVKNRASIRAMALREESVKGGDGTCRVMTCGYTEEQVLDRLYRLDKVLDYAQEHQMQVTWG